MIAVKLMGGLGNQMFQYAACRRLAASHNTRVLLDISHYNNQPKEEVPRHYELGCFSIKARLANEPVEKTGIRSFLKMVEFDILNEGSFSFNPEVLVAPDNTLLIGYWQSERYFHDIAEQIRKDFILKDPLSEDKQKIADRIIRLSQSVSVQVRRGDYVSHERSSKFHGALPLSYYRMAVMELTKSIKSPNFFVISDDPEWCRQNLIFDYPTTYIEHIPNTGHEDMYLTSLCRHNIIANSTFSWWGAWLNMNPEKIVILPRNWFKDKKFSNSDIVPSNWIRV